jgi:hypothetical protein
MADYFCHPQSEKVTTNRPDQYAPVAQRIEHRFPKVVCEK